MRRWGRARYGALLVLAAPLLGCALALSAPVVREVQGSGCRGFSERSLVLDGVGSAYFTELRVHGEVAELYGGICLESEARLATGEPRWTLRSERLSVDGRASTARFALEEAALTLESWLIEAGALVGAEGVLSLSDVRFRSAHTRGSAKTARYDLERDELTLTAPVLDTAGYQVVAARAELSGASLRLSQAVATSCRLDEPMDARAHPPLQLSAAHAELDVADGRTRLSDTVLTLGALALPLGSVGVLSAEALASVNLPVSVGVLDRLGLSALAALPLDGGLGLELGAVGLDTPAPAGVFLLTAAAPGVRAAVGRSRFGPQADVEVTRALAPWLRAVFGIHNRHWADADFLHEGFLRLEATSGALSPLGDDHVELSLAATLAASSQRLAIGPILSARSGLTFGTRYRAPPSPLGQFALVQQASFFHYPQARASQWGLRLRPSWSGRWGPLGLALDYDLQLTDSGSPFSARLDRLRPLSLLDFTLFLEDARPTRLALAGRYDALLDVPWRRLELSASSEAETAAGRLRARLALEAAALLSPRYDPDVEAFAALELTLLRAGWELGFGGRYAFVSRGPGALERLELSAAWPLRGPALTLQPFLALDLSAPFSGRGPLVLAGHGLELEVATCCGVLAIGYRAHRGRLTTRLGLGVEDSVVNGKVANGKEANRVERP